MNEVFWKWVAPLLLVLILLVLILGVLVALCIITDVKINNEEHPDWNCTRLDAYRKVKRIFNINITEMKNLLLTLWQLPQCLLGYFLCLFFKEDDYTYYNGIYVRFSDKMRGGISLGGIIILSQYYNNGKHQDVIAHEYGHTRQSLYLGWLYLIVIGIPSLLWATFYKGDMKGYYTGFYTERWADKLGGVER